jgi:hypothetical protein
MKYSIIIFTLISVLVSACSDNFLSNSRINPNETILGENFLYPDFIFEDDLIENQLAEIYLQEKTLVEEIVKEQLLSESIIREVLLIETFYVPVDNPYEYYDGATGMAFFGESLDLHSLISKVSVGTGFILSLAVVSVLAFSNPISVAIITVAKNALPYTIQGAAVGTLIGAGVGATLGTTDAMDSSKRLSALTSLALSTTFLITSIIFPPLAGTAFAVWGAVTAITASSIGLVFSGINAYEAFSRTDDINLDSEALDWDKLGYSIAERTIEGAANGFLIGAISGALIGGAKSFHKIDGKMVLLDNSTFDPSYIDSLGRSNLQRMQSGLAPIGKDGYSVNLHHLDQTNNGAVAEMMQSVHRSNYYTIHSNTGQYPSLIDRPGFGTWRNNYWIWRSSNTILN